MTSRTKQNREELIINSGVEERKKEEEELIININNEQKVNNQFLRQRYIHKSLAFLETEESIQLLRDLEVIAKRDQWSFSRLAYEALKEYRERHPTPNPQASLDRVFQVQMPHKPSWQCCVGRCRAKAKYHLFLKNFAGKTETFPVCYRHRNWKHKTFRWLVGKKELKP